jgi:hypothetical protein
MYHIYVPLLGVIYTPKLRTNRCMKEAVETRVDKPDMERIERLEEQWNMTTAGTLRRLIQTGLRAYDGGMGAPSIVAREGEAQDPLTVQTEVGDSAEPIGDPNE